jgi:hypothetical protein
MSRKKFSDHRGAPRRRSGPATLAVWCTISLAPSALLYWYAVNVIREASWTKFVAILWFGCSAWGLVVAAIAAVQERSGTRH